MLDADVLRLMFQFQIVYFLKYVYFAGSGPSNLTVTNGSLPLQGDRAHPYQTSEGKILLMDNVFNRGVNEISRKFS